MKQTGLKWTERLRDEGPMLVRYASLPGFVSPPNSCSPYVNRLSSVYVLCNKLLHRTWQLGFVYLIEYPFRESLLNDQELQYSVRYRVCKKKISFSQFIDALPQHVRKQLTRDLSVHSLLLAGHFLTKQ